MWENRRNTFAIHYSCESFVDNPELTSPRVATIAVSRIDGVDTESFSVHHEAQKLGADLGSPQDFEQSEKAVLEAFEQFKQQHVNATYVHWNMRDARYGFAALDHRARLNGIDPAPIQPSQRTNLADLLEKLYSSGYASDPKLREITQINGLKGPDFLDGKEESEAFRRQDFAALYRSSLRKADLLGKLSFLAERGKLQHAASDKDVYGLDLDGIRDIVENSRVAKIYSILAMLVAPFLLLYQLARFLD